MKPTDGLKKAGTRSEYWRDLIQQPKFLIEHIFKVFGNRGWIKYAESIGGDLYMDVWWVSPELRRKLEGNG